MRSVVTWVGILFAVGLFVAGCGQQSVLAGTPRGADTLATTGVSAVDTQREQVNQAVAAAGLGKPVGYSDAFALGHDICGSLASVAGLPDNQVDPKSISSPGEWLYQRFSKGMNDEFRVLKVVVPIMCPQFADAVSKAEKGVYPLGYRFYEVGPTLGKVAPGVYRIVGTGGRCYWARTDVYGGYFKGNGASSIGATVTIEPSDRYFDTSCAWIPVSVG